MNLSFRKMKTASWLTREKRKKRQKRNPFVKICELSDMSTCRDIGEKKIYLYKVMIILCTVCAAGRANKRFSMKDM